MISERSGRGQDEGSGQGQEERSGRGQARLGMSGHAPAEGAADTPRRRAGNQADQSGADTKPSPSNQELTWSPWTPITAEPAFSSLYGSPARTIKPLPHPSHFADSIYPADSFYPADALCFADPPRSPAYPPPGVLPESDRPIKGSERWSIGVVPSSSAFLTAGLFQAAVPQLII